MPTTADPNTVLALRFRDLRPGLDLVTIIDAAVPVASLKVRVLAQERKAFPLLDEFVLRMAHAGVDSEPELAAVLGLDEDSIASAIADQYAADTIRPRHEGGRRLIQLTPKGLEAVAELSAVRPVRADLDLQFDRLVWHVRPYERRRLVSRQEAEDEGLLLLPVGRSAEIGADDVPVSAINTLLTSQGEEALEILEVQKVTPVRGRRYQHAKLLVFSDTRGTDVQLAVVVNGETSSEHELSLAKAGGAANLGIHIDTPSARPELDHELEQARVPAPDVTRLRLEAAAGLVAAVPQLVPKAVAQRAKSAADELDRIEVRSVEMFEHAELLQEALTAARHRILIISPWIKNRVVTTDFASKLRDRLKRKVKIDIAYGYEEDLPDEHALRRLTRLAADHPDLFTLTWLRNTHAKILIFDDRWISTSFNWLSFQGRKDRTYRMEEGTLVRNPERADMAYTRYVEMIKDQARQ